MTFKDLKKRVVPGTAQQQKQSKLFEQLQNKPFWIWDQQQHKLERRGDYYVCIVFTLNNAYYEALYDFG